VRHFSDFPFTFRTDGGPRDDFEREALVHLRADPTQPYYRFSQVAGASVLRFATARVMQASCVECHNNHADSPKTDWKVGDVRGALSITQSLGNDLERTQRGLRGTFLALGGAMLGTLALFSFFGMRNRGAQG